MTRPGSHEASIACTGPSTCDAVTARGRHGPSASSTRPNSYTPIVGGTAQSKNPFFLIEKTEPVEHLQNGTRMRRALEAREILYLAPFEGSRNNCTKSNFVQLQQTHNGPPCKSYLSSASRFHGNYPQGCIPLELLNAPSRAFL